MTICLRSATAWGAHLVAVNSSKGWGRPCKKGLGSQGARVNQKDSHLQAKTKQKCIHIGTRPRRNVVQVVASGSPPLPLEDKAEAGHM